MSEDNKTIKKNQKEKEKPPAEAKEVPEIGGQTGPSPTRYGDWEKNGRCTDF